MWLLSPTRPNRQVALRWARLAVDIRTPLRRGGWYRVLSAGPEEAVLAVRGTSVIVPRPAVEILSSFPRLWSVVPREWGGPYLVCPDCATRLRVPVRSELRVCPGCRGVFPVETPDHHARASVETRATAS